MPKRQKKGRKSSLQSTPTNKPTGSDPLGQIAIQDLQKKAEAYSKDIQDTKKSLEDTEKSLEVTEKSLEDTQKSLEDTQNSLQDTQNNLGAKSKDIEEVQKALIKHERTFDAYTIEVRRSRWNTTVYGDSIPTDYDMILREVNQQDSRVDRWKPAFESHYNVSWELLHTRRRLDSASKELVRIFDYLANTRSLEK
ncbi:hypothetical protein PITC_037740 [Penicillium italicum]|uniref:Uncharacterized protein n=1 Tax=Penicillium italicum TaxID=40296 RepID=A0A0A2LE46_PENIT|nr:hypothetical protein PITC_037740 [Penicillium italicum]